MHKKRGKVSNTPKKVVSLMFVPHNSGNVKTWRISNIHLKIVTLFSVFIVIFVALAGYLTVVTHENRQLQKQQKELYSFFTEQQNIVENNIAILSEAENLDKVTKETIDEISYKIQDVTRNYIDKEIKTLTVSRSKAVSNPSVSFVGKVAELRALLNFLEDNNVQEDKMFDEISGKKAELQDYLNHLPILWPTEGSIESEFGNRFHPVHKKFLDHTGADIGGALKNPIYAAASGTVISAGKNGGYGYCIDIDHGNGIVTRYAHCSKILVKKGQKVVVGKEIAKVGNTGVTTGPHLHFEIRINDIPVDPTIFIGEAP